MPTVDEIPVAHTPPGGYGAEMPPPILAGCTDHLAPGAPDLRGIWQVVEVEADGSIQTDHPALGLVQRIEQCADRIVVTGSGVIHDMRADGTLEHGVHDVAQFDKETRIDVVASYEDGVHVLRPDGIPIEVTRRRDGEQMVWHYLGFVARLTRIDTVDTAPLVLDSLRRRMRALHSLYEDAVATMDLDHVNHVERDGALPIAFSLFHIVNMMDASFMLLTGQAPIWDDEWQARVQMAVNDHGKHRTVDEMSHQRMGDYEAFQEYMALVFERTERHLATMDPAELTRVVITHPYPPQVASTYSARVGGEAGITVLDGFECWIYQHGLRHMGEIEWARGGLGLGGMTS